MAERLSAFALRGLHLVQQGWVTNMDELIAESMRRYLDSHREAMTEQLFREDVDWGLHGAG